MGKYSCPWLRREVQVAARSGALKGSAKGKLCGVSRYAAAQLALRGSKDTVSVPGVYGGFPDKIPFGAIVNKSLTIRSGQTHVHRYLPELTRRIQNGEIDPSFVITHRLPLSQAPKGYEMFRDKKDGCIKIVLDPAA